MMPRPGARRFLLAPILALAAACAGRSVPAGPVAFPSARPIPAESRPAPAAPGTGSGTVDAGPVARDPDAAASAVAATEAALSLVGVRYVFGGEDPDTGVDCSGLVRFVFGRQQVELPRTVEEQFDAGRPVNLDDVREGDLLFFSTTGPGATHVGIALGAAAPGLFVHAPGTGQVVRTERYDTSYWRARFLGARRIGG